MAVRRGLSLVLVLALATVACGTSDTSDSGARGEPTTTTSPASTSTTDPWAVPAKIDVAYVQRVVDELSRIAARAWERTRQQGKVDPQVERLLLAISSGAQGQMDIEELQGSVRQGFSDWVERPQPGSTRVRQVETISPRCIRAAGAMDFRKAVRNGGVRSVVIELRRVKAAADATNPTGWIKDGVWAAGEAPAEGKPCERG
ncbi:MAG: hypothetical protein HYX34_05740 [Actinobacteria bacterium]|nr:hypothetical protein [Actinomycetota bacterium]